MSLQLRRVVTGHDEEGNAVVKIGEIAQHWREGRPGAASLQCKALLNTDHPMGECIMEIVLRKYGNSTVLAFPPPLLRDLGLAAGQSMTLHARADGTITLAPKRKYTLKQLLAQCDLKAAPPRDMALWDNARPVGGEVW